MKRIFFLLISFSFLASFAMALNVPGYKGRVNDFTKTLTPNQASTLEKKLEQYEAQTSNQIAVLIINSLEGDNLEDFSIRVAESWKVGQKGKDNGVIILIAKNDRKMRIEVGRGLEGALTDLTAGRIIDTVMKPEFRKENFYNGIDKAVDSIELAVKGEFKAEPKRSKSKDWDSESLLVVYGILYFVAGIIGLIHIFFSGAVGAIGTYFLTSWFFNPSQWVLIAVAAIGFFIGMLAKVLIENMPSGSGGGYSSGGYSSGSSSGGFSGFGGGGASGSW